MKTKQEKLMAILVVVIAVIATATIAFGESHQTKELHALGAGSTLVPTGVNNSLNITFSDVTYSTVAPAFEFERGNYNVNATWINPGVKDVNITNATYLVMQSNLSASLAQVQYDLAHYNKNASYFFMETKLAENFSSTVTNTVNIAINSSGVSALQTESSVNTTSNELLVVLNDGGLTIDAHNSSGSKTTLNGQVATDSGSSSKTMSALQFYDLAVYAYNNATAKGTDITVALINPANGSVITSASLSNLPVAGFNYTKLSDTAFQFEGDSGSAMILDWGYFVFSGSSALSTSPSIVPFTSGASPDVIMNGLINSNAIAPFDPSASNNTQYKQAPNATYIHTNTAVGSGQFNNKTILSNETAALQSEGAYNVNSLATFGVGNQTSANSTAMVANLTLNKENTNSFTADVHISTWNATGIQTAVMKFLKNYTANLATINTGIAYSYKNMTIISYMISNIQTITNLSASDASAVRDYFDNAFPAILKANNLSLVDTNTSAIVAGAFAGDFYYSGMAIVPSISNGIIVNPITDQKFANLSDAGFAAGAYISGGAVIVPQLTLLGWDAGAPIFASGFSFGNIFGGLTSAGSSVFNYLHNGVSDISGAISSGASKAVQNYIVKPITSTATDAKNAVSSYISHFKSDTANLTSAIAPALGVVTNDVEKGVKGAIGPISGAVSDLSSSLASAKNGIVTAVAAGASGLKSDIYTLGTQIKNGTQGIVNTLGAKIASTNAVLSSMFTAVKSLPGTFASDLSSVASVLKNSTLSALDTVGTTVKNAVSGGVNDVKSVVTNAYGAVASRITGAVGYIKNGLSSAWSFITSFGAKLGFILEIVGITIAIIVIVGLILYFGVIKKGSSMVAGETRIKSFDGSNTPISMMPNNAIPAPA